MNITKKTINNPTYNLHKKIYIPRKLIEINRDPEQTGSYIGNNKYIKPSHKITILNITHPNT